jgi:hypothetical protein
MTRPPEIDLVYKTITSDNSGNEGIDSQPHVTINSADFMVCDVQKNSRVMRRYLLSIFRSHIPSLPNAHVEAENNNNATQQPKKAKLPAPIHWYPQPKQSRPLPGRTQI